MEHCAGWLTGNKDEPTRKCKWVLDLEAENKRLREAGLKGNIPLVILDQIEELKRILGEAWNIVSELVEQVTENEWPVNFGYSKKDVERINKRIEQALSGKKGD